jgi:TonB family protein
LGILPARELSAADFTMEVKTMSAYAQHDSGYFSRRSGTFFLVASLHAVIFYGLLTALAQRPGPVPIDPLQYKVLQDPRPRELLPRLPNPVLDHVRINVPIPDVAIPSEPDPVHDVMTDTVGAPTLPPPAPPREVKQVQGGPGAGFPNPDDFYPALARYKEEQGSATVRVCVDAHGRLTSDPVTVQGSGSSVLDEGALKLARAGSGHYRASTEDGRPVNSCYPLRVRFQMKN